MEYVMLIYETPLDFEARTSAAGEAFRGAWRAYHKALVESDVFVGGDPLEVPETGTTSRPRMWIWPTVDALAPGRVGRAPGPGLRTVAVLTGMSPFWRTGHLPVRGRLISC